MTFYLRADLAFECTAPERDTDENFDSFTDVLMDELCNLEDVDDGIIDPDLTAAIVDRTAAILMGISADTFPDAVRLFLANVRTVLHASGCATQDSAFKPTTQRPTVREADYSSA